MGAIWVPWRLGATAREQQIRRQGRQVKGRLKAAEARGKTIKKHREALFRQLKAGKITRKEYDRAIRKLGQ